MEMMEWMRYNWVTTEMISSSVIIQHSGTVMSAGSGVL